MFVQVHGRISHMPSRISSRPSSRRRKPSSIVGSTVIAVAIVGAAALISRRDPVPPPVEAAAPVVGEFDTVRIPVPVELVVPGRKLKDVRFKMVAYPTHQVPERALRAVDGFGDYVALAPLPANLPLYAENIGVGAQGTNAVLERIPPGMRAMTIRVDATSAVEGWASAGSIVDVLLVEKDRTTVIAENVTILSAERSTAPVEGNSAPSVPSTVTLLVSQEQCLAINTAIPLGRIAFALRGTRDSEHWENGSFTSDRLVPDTNRRVVRTAEVRGFVELKDGPSRDGQSTERYALRDGKWIASEVVPEGFFAARGRPKQRAVTARQETP